MFLSIDVGNTQTTIALFDEEGACTQQWRMASAPSDTSDSLHARLYSSFQMYGLSLADVDAAALASVVPLLTDAWCRLFARHHVLVGVSLDGPQAVHDACRIHISIWNMHLYL